MTSAKADGPGACPRCGSASSAGARFCTACGLALAGSPRTAAGLDPGRTATYRIPAILSLERGKPDPETAATIAALPSGSALLVVLRGPGAGSRYLLDTDLVTIGRAPDSDIFLDDVTVSRRHAEIVRSEDIFHVRDAGSLNGTYVDRERVDTAELLDRSELQIGKYRMVMYLAPPPDDAL